MKEKFLVTVNPNTLVAELQYQGSDLKVLNDLRLFLSNINPDIKLSANEFRLAWHDLKSSLIYVVQIANTNRIELVFDQLGGELVREFIDDRKRFKVVSSTNTQEDINKLLAQTDFRRELKPEQIRDASTLLNLKHGANFSVPGAGKTTTLLAVYSILKLKGVVSSLFVICPINAFISWEDEINRIFTRPQKIIRLRVNELGNFSDVIRQNPDVILVNYEKLRKEISSLLSYFLTNNVHLILDESHRIKSGGNNLSYSLISKLADLAKRRDVLSGTPMPQSYLDLKPQFELLWPGEKIIPEPTSSEDSVSAQSINSAIARLYVRTTKSELKLANPNIFVTKIKLGSIQGQLYQLFKSEAARIYAGMENDERLLFRNIGKSVVRLLQAATNPMLLGSNDDFYEDTLPVPENSNVWELLSEFVKYEKPAKLEYLKARVEKILEEDTKNKIVVWTYFVRNIRLLEKIFVQYNPVSIYGAISTGSDEDEDKREGRIKKFHVDPSCRLMIANPQACGEGISLHKVCHYAIYLDRNFNAAHFLQSIDRIHRLGLEEGVETNVEILVAQETVDEILIQRLSEKIMSMGKVLDDKYLQTLAYDPLDIAVDDGGIDRMDVLEIRKHIFAK